MAYLKYIIFTLVLSALILLATNPTAAQGVAIGETNTLPDPSAALDVQSVTKGMLTPRMTRAQRNAIAGPANGLVVYQTNDVGAESHGYWYYDATVPAWLPLDVTMYTGIVEQPGTLVSAHNHTATITSLDDGQTQLNWTIPGGLATRPSVLVVPEYTVIGTPPEISDYCQPTVGTCNASRQSVVRLFSPDSDFPGLIAGANNFSSTFFQQPPCSGSNVNYHYVPFDGGSYTPGSNHNNTIIDFCANPTGEIALWTTSAFFTGKSFSVWIDLNQDGDFTDPGEDVATFSSVGGNHAFGTAGPNGPPISVPNTANTVNGITKMRIIVTNGTTPVSASCFGGDGQSTVYDIDVDIQCATGGAPFFPSEINWCNIDEVTTNSARVSCFDQNGTPTDLKYHYKIISHD